MMLGSFLGGIAGAFSDLTTKFTSSHGPNCPKHPEIIERGHRLGDATGRGMSIGGTSGASYTTMRSVGHYAKLSRDRTKALRKAFTADQLKRPISLSWGENKKE